MSFLEYLGLEYIFNSMDNNNSSDSATGCGGILFIVGVLGWLLLAIFRSSLIDKAATVFNLVAFIGIIIVLGAKFYFAKKNNKLNVGFLVASILVIIISFFIGSRTIYHSAIYISFIFTIHIIHLLYHKSLVVLFLPFLQRNHYL